MKGSLSRTVYLGWSLSRGSLSREFSVQGGLSRGGLSGVVFVQGGLCCGVSVFWEGESARGVCGVSVQGVCVGGSLSVWGSLSSGGVWEGSLS